MLLHMVADMVVNEVADMLLHMVVDMAADKKKVFFLFLADMLLHMVLC